MPIGVLALQGDFQAHADALQKLGEAVVFVKRPQQLAQCEGLVIPGGESTTMLTLMHHEPIWFDAIKNFAKQQWVFGTCAGMILMAKHVIPEQPSLDLMNITVLRNAYGRQIDSRVIQLPYQSLDQQLHSVEVVFIRAPQIQAVGEGVSILIEESGTPLLVQQNNMLAASFHPESNLSLTLYQDCLQRLRQSVS